MPKWIFLFLTLHPALCTMRPVQVAAVFWNVGQGQWITVVSADTCRHYDFGGEISYWQKNKNLLLKLCRDKQNILHLSHADLDHYAYYPLLLKSLKNICWHEVDHAAIPAKRKPRKIPLCLEQNPYGITSRQHLRLYNPTNFRSKNDSSKVYAFKNLLLPGDSPKKHEKIWAPKLKDPKSFTLLQLGHHGSRSSSSDLLFKNLSQIKMAIAQARKKRFNHPHPETAQRLKKYRIPLLTTEDWGNTAVILE